MPLKHLLRVSNGRIRLAVGLFLASMLCIHCTSTQATREQSQFATAISGQTIGKNAPAVTDKVEKLAAGDQIGLLEMCLDHYRANYRDYTCQFVKQERIGGKLGSQQEIQVKFLGQPYSVSMFWTKNRPIADRVLYIEGKWDNQMLVRPAGLLALAGPQFRKPDDAEAMRNTLRPVNAFGFERIMTSLLGVYRQAHKNGDLRQDVGYKDQQTGKLVKYADVGGRKTIILARYLPLKDNYPTATTLLFMDMEYLVPVMLENYDWEGNLSSRYVFQDIKFNVGLTSDDFLPEANDIKGVK